MSSNSAFHNRFFVFICALVIPLPLIFIESLLPFPYLIEEMAKGLLLVLLPKPLKLLDVVITAFLFSLSENMFYLSTLIASGSASDFWKRFLLVTPIHIITMLIIYFLYRKNPKLLIPGIILAAIVHYFYNSLILTMI